MARILAVLALVLLAALAAVQTRVHAAQSCTPTVSRSYAQGVGRVVRSGTDVWGAQLLHDPTYDAAAKKLPPILFATQRNHRPLTKSRVYYLALSYPAGENAPQTFALHVADGSEIISRFAVGPSLTIDVGQTGHERYGSCLRRATLATLANGYLPILETSYTDAGGVQYDEESFAGRIGGAKSIVSFVKLVVDAQQSKAGATVRFVATDPTRLITDADVVHVPAGATTTVYAAWVHDVPLLKPIKANAYTYDRARTAVSDYWDNRLAQGMQIQVPDDTVTEAEKAILVQQLTQGWRYSVGNDYEELSYAEAMDTAQVMAEYGYLTAAQGILRLGSLRLPDRFSALRAGGLMLSEALYYGESHDRAFVDADASAMADTLGTLAARQLPSGLLQPEPLSTDLGGAVNGLPAQVVAWEGLLAAGRMWAVTGHSDLAAKAGAIALKLEPPLRAAVRKHEVRLKDGSLFVPDTLDGQTKAYKLITFTRAGSYWNLVMPYVFASGFFPAGRSDTNGILKYLALHGARLLGVPRADAHVVFGKVNGQGLGQVYGQEAARFLADNDQSDVLALSLYGQLGTAMTQGTFVSGEAISVLPVGTAYYRSMYMPPNLGANSSYLETLRLLLVHERRGTRGAPDGLDLAFSTPRSWLVDGGSISVEKAPTSFGDVSYTVTRDGTTVTATVKVPKKTSVRLRFRLPSGTRILRVRGASAFNKATATATLPRRAHVRLTVTLAAPG
ncbi:MAG TPA: hypothetical protein VGU02_08725 [Gaiellaceae bacterium]|nr:hypothetical protein [Gaiellaceae bacterium]